LGLGVDVLTGGNHSLHQKGCDALFDDEERLLRPANFPPGTPGRGWVLLESAAGFPVATLNVCGRAFMEPFADPFRCVSQLVKEARARTPIILVDFHAETTSEKIAMGWFLDGQVSAVFGTHTHVQTADERVLPNGTGYITDTGMTGPYESVIGADREIVLEAMMTMRAKRFDVAPGHDVRVCGAFLEVDPMDGRARRMERVRVDLGNL
jgi:2',3'-cyclic-nucleotide 2'-phosphodiesterase